MAYFKATVTGGSLNLRAAASASSRSLISIPNGTELITNGNNIVTWVNTHYGTKHGYVMTQYLNFTGSAERWEYLFGTKLLYNGCSDSYFVRNLQTYLQAHGESLTVDGSFGPGTYTAVCNFQAKKGLQVDGKAGPATKRALLEPVTD